MNHEEATVTPADAAQQRLAGLRLLAVFLGILAVAAAAGYLTTVLVVFAVIFMIMVHELGHFVTAKLFGMKVTEFFLGFGPRLWSIKRGETEYGIKAIPAGGYNRIVGMSNLEDVDEADEPRAYRQKGFLQKVIVAGAGSFMHAVMAFLLLFSIYAITGIPSSSAAPVVGELTPSSDGRPTPAQDAGLRPGDAIVALDGIPTTTWNELPAYIGTRAGQTVVLTVERNGERLTVPVVPRSVPSETGAPIGVVGVGPKLTTVRIPPLEAVGVSFSKLGEFSVATVKGIGRIFSPAGLESYTNQLVTSLDPQPANQPVAAPQERFISPVGLVGIANNAAESGWREVLMLLFSINIFVGIFNLIPLLPFDGGHIAIATYERIRSFGNRRHMADYAKLLPVSYVVLVALVLISLTSLWLDIVKPLPNPF